jgi:adenosylcobinamide-GDP ribazoletransferase
MNVLAYQLRLLLLALQFLTRVPITGGLAHWAGYSPEMLRASARFFPLVGALVGACAALVFGLLSLVWPLAVAAVLTLCFTALLTGAFHEDGLADYADGIGGGSSAQHVLAIMKDSRIGSYGALALVLATTVKLVALISLSLPQALLALLLAHVIGRACACCVLAGLPYVRDDDGAKSKPLAHAMHSGELAFALLTVAAVVALAGLWQPQAALHTTAAVMLAGLCSLLLARQMARRIGGFTGDALGAVEQVAECAVLLAFTLTLPKLLS